MAHFLGAVIGGRGEMSRLGSKKSGLTTIAASWNGAIQTTLWHNHETGKDEYSVSLVPWKGVGRETHLARGSFEETPNVDSN